MTICVGVGLMTIMRLLGPAGSREVLMIDSIGQLMRAVTILGLWVVGMILMVKSVCAGLDPLSALAGCACIYTSLKG